MNRRNFLGSVSAGFGVTAGCLSPSEGNPRSEATLVIENQRDSDVEVRIRFEDGDIVVFDDTVALSAGDQSRGQHDLSRGATDIDVFVDPTPGEGVYEEPVPGDVPEYRVVIHEKRVDVMWAEN